jgi:hypothetical protein
MNAQESKQKRSKSTGIVALVEVWRNLSDLLNTWHQRGEGVVVATLTSNAMPEYSHIIVNLVIRLALTSCLTGRVQLYCQTSILVNSLDLAGRSPQTIAPEWAAENILRWSGDTQ